jgi:hypothetical protein
MRALLIHAGHNTTKPDATGAFIPEAKNYAKWLTAQGWTVERYPFDNRAQKLQRRREVEGLLREGDPVQHFAFFGHGLAKGLQSGHDLATVSTLAEALAVACNWGRLVVTLYACDAADGKGPGGDGGFADALRDALSERGITGHVDAHVTTGHTTRNPHLRRFYMDGAAVGTGGDWLVAPGSPKWRRWVTALKGDMRFRFPWLTAAEIDAAL